MKLKIGHKLSLGFAGVIVLLAFIVLEAFIGINKVSDDNKELGELEGTKATLLERYIDHLKWTNEVGHTLLNSTDSQLDVETDPHQCALGRWYYGQGRVVSELMLPEIKSRLDSMEAIHNKLHRKAHEINGHLKNGEREEALLIFNDETMGALQEIEALSMDINSTVSQRTLRQSVDVVSHSVFQKAKIALIGVVALILSIIVARLITTSLLKGIKAVVSASNRLSQGDLDIEIDHSLLEKSDEIGDLSRSMAHTVKKLEEVVASIYVGAEQVAYASDQINSTSQLISEAASEQAASVEEVSSSMEQMVANIKGNTVSAVNTEGFTVSVSSKVDQVSQVAHHSLDSVREITDRVAIINDIAQQTNILALNAAVESVQAGENGRGFAIVASEVRKLAERSKDAAGEIMRLSSTSLQASENTNVIVEGILPDIQQTASLVADIASASREQNLASEQINKALHQLNSVTQQNASASEELATSSVELSSQAEQLKETISYFKLIK